MSNSTTSAAKAGDFNLVAYFQPLTEAMRDGFPFLDGTLDDSTAVLTSTSLIDHTLQLGLTATFYRGAVSKSLMARVFEGNGSLATFSAKIDLAHVQGLTSEEQNHDLQIIRKVRNAFAHSSKPQRLKDFAACDNLRMTSHLQITRESARVEKFLSSASAIIPELMMSVVATLAKQQIIRENKDRYLAVCESVLATVYENSNLGIFNQK